MSVSRYFTSVCRCVSQSWLHVYILRQYDDVDTTCMCVSVSVCRVVVPAGRYMSTYVEICRHMSVYVGLCRYIYELDNNVYGSLSV